RHVRSPGVFIPAAMPTLRTILSTSVSLVSLASTASGQTAAGALRSRDELAAAVARAEQSGKPFEASALRERLRDGDFQVGDRIVLSFFSDAKHTDTLTVRPGRVIDLPGASEVALTGLLRSDLKDRVTEALLKYVKARDIDVTPLTRIAVLGEVVHPGYFDFR